MANKLDVSGYERFSDVTSRLDEIIGAVRDKNTSLERSLDLFDEAIALGTRAVDLVDKAAFSPEEMERMADVDTGEAAHEGTGAAPDKAGTQPGAGAGEGAAASAKDGPSAGGDA